jgi:starch synthase
MHILFATSEVYPLVKTGGLADVSYNLPQAFKNLRHSVRVVIPAYQSVLNKLNNNYKVLKTFQLEQYSVRILETQIAPSGLKVWLVDIPPYFNRPGNPYVNEQGDDWSDNALRFGLFCKIAALIASNQIGLKWKVDIAHCNDWQTGLIPIYLDIYFDKKIANLHKKPKTIFTIHNLAYQGLHTYNSFEQLDLPNHLWSYKKLEYYGKLSFIKGGLVFADKITTVSPTYAEEVLTPEFGCGLDGLLIERQKDLIGIINGIDDSEWNPATDTNLSKTYSVKTLSEKSKNKVTLQKECQFPLLVEKKIKPLVLGIVSRLSEQKGLDLLIESITELIKLPIQLVILGSGESSYESTLTHLAKNYPDKIHVTLGYNEALAHRIIAGADVFLMPSQYEPCGLTQLYSLRYGTLPLVRAVGGLADTVTNITGQTIADKTANGFSFNESTAIEFRNTIERALLIFNNKTLWKDLQYNGMKQDFSWKISAKQYLKLYKDLL